MKPASLYKRLLWLYPPGFRKEFSAEMLEVFQQRAKDRFAGKELPFVFFCAEFIGLIKGAYVMWLSKVVSINRKPVQSQTAEAETPLTLAHAKAARQGALNRMVAAIANHDFVNARRYSEEEHRLTAFIRTSENAGPAERIRMA
jgi:hypothetical protein